jgi:putative ABC transport system substrate-binding protein
MRRRKFITMLGGAVAWPAVTRAQQPERMRRIGFLTPNAETAPETQTWIKEFTQRLTELGWTSGGNIRIDYRFGNADVPLLAAANELIESRPDVVLAVGTPGAAALRQRTLSIPIVFVQVADPVALGAARGQHYRFHQFRVFDRREMAVAPERMCAQRRQNCGGI